jgi:polyhydroxybutyrate depolymerase
MMRNVSKLILFTSAAFVITSACSGGESPIRDKIRAQREARAGGTEDGTLRERIKAAREARAAERGGPREQRSDGETLTIDVGGLSRTAILQEPKRAGGRVPVVIALHGGTREASDIFARTSWPQIARREGVLLVAPQGENNQWNDGRGSTISGKESTADDVAFLSALIDVLVRAHNADPRAIFFTGVSNGGLMTMRFACERASSVGAAAPVIATLPQALVASCRGASPVPALFMAGTADPLMTYDGKPSAILTKRGDTAPMLSIPATLDLWRKRNRCEDKGTARDLPDLNKNDQSTVTRIDYRPCASGAPVIHYRINGGGHQQPSLQPQQVSSRFSQFLGPQNNDIDGPEEIWRFFAAQVKR